MNGGTRRVIRIAASMLILLAGLVSAADYAIDWSTTDGGGAGVSDASTGGSYTLSGTIGQPDAGVVMTGGDYSLTGGFWVIPPPPPELRITAWRSVRTHGGLGDLAIELDPAADAMNATMEPRSGGIQWIEVDFNEAVQVAGAIEAVDVNSSAVYPATTVALANGDKTLMVRFDPSVLPDQVVYGINLAGAIQGTAGQALAGDTDCMIRALIGDVDGGGLVDNSDMIQVRVRRGQPASEANCVYDVSCNGVIDNSDMIAIRVRRGNEI